MGQIIDYLTSRRDYVKEQPKIRNFNVNKGDNNNWMVGINTV